MLRRHTVGLGANGLNLLEESLVKRLGLFGLCDGLLEAFS